MRSPPGVRDQLRASLPKPAALLEEAEVDVLAFMGFPKEHWTKICSTNPINRKRPVWAVQPRGLKFHGISASISLFGRRLAMRSTVGCAHA
jgi:hypothetical protein